mmetsp:Transcript_141500/g.394298  ORF Transcript_141500/g.394298 Transcript_141500/m.394298 type:complete len:281 (-) Transcript_141500:122-964(-)
MSWTSGTSTLCSTACGQRSCKHAWGQRAAEAAPRLGSCGSCGHYGAWRSCGQATSTQPSRRCSPSRARQAAVTPAMTRAASEELGTGTRSSGCCSVMRRCCGATTRRLSNIWRPPGALQGGPRPVRTCWSAALASSRRRGTLMRPRRCWSRPCRWTATRPLRCCAWATCFFARASLTGLCSSCRSVYSSRREHWPLAPRRRARRTCTSAWRTTGAWRSARQRQGCRRAGSAAASRRITSVAATSCSQTCGGHWQHFTGRSVCWPRSTWLRGVHPGWAWST